MIDKGYFTSFIYADSVPFPLLVTRGGEQLAPQGKFMPFC